MTVEIEVVGAVDADRAHDDGLIRALLAAPVLALDHDGEFTGRPVTAVHATAAHVLKERVAEDRPHAELVRQVRMWLARERRLGVHPPDKTWFVATLDDGVRVGNVSARLTPLHLIDAEADPEAFAGHVRTMLETYLGVASTHSVRLDEGLSNFAVDATGALFYVDDDIYAWDELEHFIQSLGVLLRRPRALTPAAAGTLGAAVARAVVTEFHDLDRCRLIADTLRGMYFNGDEQIARRDAMVAGLLADLTPRRPRRVDGTEPFALLADVHANLPALEAVLADMRACGVERGLVLGDIVGYGPHPREVIAALRAARLEILRGNHDHVAATGIRSPGFSPVAYAVIEWTRTQLGADDLAWLGALPTRIEGDGWIAQHGAPMDPAHFDAYVYRMTYQDNLDYLHDNGIRVAFHGHNHTPSVYWARGDASGLCEDAHQSLADRTAAIVCPGSVGKPRDGQVDARWALFDPASLTLEFRAVPYDLQRTIADMHAAGLPEVLVERLRAGH